jgi:hypothetical protein
MTTLAQARTAHIAAYDDARTVKLAVKAMLDTDDFAAYDAADAAFIAACLEADAVFDAAEAALEAGSVPATSKALADAEAALVVARAVDRASQNEGADSRIASASAFRAALLVARTASRNYSAAVAASRGA